MTTAKYELFDEELQETASLFKAMGHPARLAILQYLAESKVCVSGDISKELPLGRTTVNQHLAELKRAGLIKGEISGTKTRYCLEAETIKQLETLFASVIKPLSSCCGQAC